MTLIKFANGNRRQFMPASFGDMFNDLMNTDLVSRDVFKSTPAVNISESQEGYVLELAAPGMQKEDFKVEIEKGLLSISAEKTIEQNDESQKFTRKEFSYSSFTRSFNLPEKVNVEGISAGYENGILKLQLPKKEEAKQNPVRDIAVS